MEPQQDPNEVRYALNRLVERITVEYRDANTEDPARFIEMRDLEWALRTALNATKDWQARWRAANRHPVTRYSMEGDEARRSMDRTKCNVQACKTCGQPFFTEADFWKHYVISDLNYPNLGTCWTKAAPEYAGSRPEWDPARIKEA